MEKRIIEPDWNKMDDGRRELIEAVLKMNEKQFEWFINQAQLALSGEASQPVRHQA